MGDEDVLAKKEVVLARKLEGEVEGEVCSGGSGEHVGPQFFVSKCGLYSLGDQTNKHKKKKRY